MENENQPPVPAAIAVPKCPHCLELLTNVAWVVNAELGLFTIYHNEPNCMVALNCQFVQLQQDPRRITLPSEFRPVGRG